METELVGEFILHLYCKGRNADTIAEHRYNLNKWSGYLESRGIFSLFAADSETIREYYLAAKERDIVATSVLRIQRVVYVFYEWLKDTGRLLINPAPVPEYRPGERLPRNVPGWSTVKKACEQLQESRYSWQLRDCAMIDLAYSCGLRRCELQRLDIDDISEGCGTLRIRGKGSRDRYVPIGPKALKALYYYMYHVRPCLAKENRTRALFVSWQKGGKRMHRGSINKAFRTLHKRRGMDRSITPHALRHAFATGLLLNGAPVQDVSKMLGHAKLSTTQVYTKLAPKNLRDHHGRYHPRA